MLIETCNFAFDNFNCESVSVINICCFFEIAIHFNYVVTNSIPCWWSYYDVLWSRRLWAKTYTAFVSYSRCHWSYWGQIIHHRTNLWTICDGNFVLPRCLRQCIIFLKFNSIIYWFTWVKANGVEGYVEKTRSSTRL